MNEKELELLAKLMAEGVGGQLINIYILLFHITKAVSNQPGFDIARFNEDIGKSIKQIEGNGHEPVVEILKSLIE